MTGPLTTWTTVREFIFAGNATFTLRSVKTGVRYTYKVRVKKEDRIKGQPEDRVVYFVNLLRGPDNSTDFAYMGVIVNCKLYWTRKSGKVGKNSPAYRGLEWALQALTEQREGVLDAVLEVWHEGKCGRCGRKLTVPSSISRGLGDKCNEAGP